MNAEVNRKKGDYTLRVRVGEGKQTQGMEWRGRGRGMSSDGCDGISTLAGCRQGDGKVYIVAG